MPRGKRASIEYVPQFGGGIFRPKDDVEAELGELERDAVAEPAGTRGPSGEGAGAPRAWPAETDDVLVDPPGARSELANERTNGRTDERKRTRHSFDVWQDQLLALNEI